MNGSLRRSNNCMGEREWVVQKFGGTSVGKFVRKIATDIVRVAYSIFTEKELISIKFYRTGLKDNNVIVVCSAKSTGKKAEGTTSRLLGIFRLLESFRILEDPSSIKDPNSIEYQRLLDDGISNKEHDSLEYQRLSEEISSSKDPISVIYKRLVYQYERLVMLICDDHIIAAQQEIKDEKKQAILIQNIKAECKEIIDFRGAAERWRLELNGRSKDRMISFGEKLSCRLVAAVLQEHGVDSEYVDLADIIDTKSFKKLDQMFYEKVSRILREKVVACGRRVPVMTGYFGTIPGGLMDGEIGRGYTDLCASLVAVGMKAQELQIWKEVDGIFTADPNKVPTARLLPIITPAEAAELTFYGSEVIHHLTMTQVSNATPPIQIRIKNVNNPRGSGTIVLADKKLSHRLSSQSWSSSEFIRNTPKRPTAVTIKDKVSVINVNSNKSSLSHNFFAKIFSILDRRCISVDLISTSEAQVSLAIHSASLNENNMQLVKTELEAHGEVIVLNKMAIVSLIGADMRKMIGVAGRMFTALGKNNINIEMISQGASEINISCVVSAHEATRAMSILHTNLFTFLEQ